MPVKSSSLIRTKIEQYATDPRSLSNMVKSLQGHEPLFRLRVGDYRVIFTETGDVVAVEKIGHRGEVYA